MRTELRKSTKVSGFAAGLALALSFTASALADEPGRLGRLFRLGGASKKADSRPVPDIEVDRLNRPSTIENSEPLQPSRGAVPPLAPLPADAGTGDPSTIAQPSPRLVPQPRNTRAVTEADPILTRISIGRSDNGGQFGMFLQVFADGTVLDSEGVHHVNRSALKPLIDAIQASDATKIKGYCGAPATSFIEQVHVTVYDRSLNRLRANSFSYSGNPQGCDAAVRNLQTAIDAFHDKLSAARVMTTSTPAATTSATPTRTTTNRPLPLTTIP